MFWISTIAATLLLMSSVLLFGYLNTADRIDAQARDTSRHDHRETSIKRAA